MTAPEHSPHAAVTETLAHRLFQVCGVFPLSVFALLHCLLYTQLAARGSAASVPELFGTALYLPLELVFIWLPLLFHAAYGVFLIFRARASRMPLSLLPVKLSRAASLATLLFIVYHFALFRLPLLRGTVSHEDVAQLVYAKLSSTQSALPLHAVFHIAGVAVTAFHVGFGIYSHAGSGVSPDLPKPVARTLLGAVVGVALFLMGSAAVIRIAAGAFLP